MKIDRTINFSVSGMLTLGISFQKTSSSKEANRQWRIIYINFLFWEVSLLKAWTVDEEKLR